MTTPMQPEVAPRVARRRCGLDGVGRRGLALWFGLVLALHGWAGQAPPPNEVEYKIKAGYLFNFFKFVEWPAGAATRSDLPLRIGVVDDGTALPVIKSVLADKRVNGRAIEVFSAGDADPAGCQIVFIARSANRSVADLLKRLGTAPILTVGEVDQFAQSGGKINFVLKGENIRLEINLAAAEAAGLKVSSKLASMGTLVHSKR